MCTGQSGVRACVLMRAACIVSVLVACVKDEGGGGLIKPPPIYVIHGVSTTFVRSSHTLDHETEQV